MFACLGDSQEAQIQRATFEEAWTTGAGLEVAWSISGALRDAGNVDGAIELLERVTDEYPDTPWAPLLLAGRGDLMRFKGRHDDALMLFDRAERSRFQSSVVRQYTRFYASGFRGNTWRELGLLKLAEQYFELQQRLAPSMRTTSEGGAFELFAIAQLGLQGVEFRLGLYRLAEQRTRDMLGHPGIEQAPDHLPQLLVRLGQALIHRARDAEAGLDSGDVEALLEEAEQAFQRALDGELSATYEERQLARIGLTDLYWQRGDREAERGALEASYSEPEGELQTLWAGDRAAYRARRVLADEDSTPAQAESCLKEIEAVFYETEQNWLDVERSPEGLGFLHWDEQRLVLGVWIELLIAVHGPERGTELALEALVRAQSIGTLTRRVAKSMPGPDPSPSETLESFRRALPPASGVLIFLPSMDTSHVLAFDAKEVLHVELEASRRVLQKAAGPVIRFAQTPPNGTGSSAGQQAARALAELLFPDEIEARLRSWKRVVFVGSELLGDPVLEWLPLGDRPLGELLATSYLPSLELGQHLTERVGRTGFDPGEVVVLTADGMPGGPDLEPAERARLVEWSTPEGASTPALRPGGWENLGGGLLIALAHGEYRANQPRPAHLLMPEGAVGAEQLEHAAMPPVVCLLACGAARGTIQKGDDGVAHLGAASIVGGAAAVLLARSKIETAASLALLGHLLEELKAGSQPDEALRSARVRLAQTRPEWSHPFYSSSIRLFGLGFFPPD